VSLRHLLLFEIVLTLVVTTAGLSASALGGWLSAIRPHNRQNKPGAWMNIALVCGTGIASVMEGELVREYAMGGLAGSFAIDTAVGTAACILLDLLLYWIPSGGFGTRINAIEPRDPLLSKTDTSALSLRLRGRRPYHFSNNATVRYFCPYRNI